MSDNLVSYIYSRGVFHIVQMTSGRRKRRPFFAPEPFIAIKRQCSAMSICESPPECVMKGEKNTMKKFLALILALAMLLSMAACGGDANTDATAAPDGTGTSEPAQGDASVDTSDIYGGVEIQKGGTFVIGASGDP